MSGKGCHPQPPVTMLIKTEFMGIAVGNNSKSIENHSFGKIKIPCFPEEGQWIYTIAHFGLFHNLNLAANLEEPMPGKCNYKLRYHSILNPLIPAI